MRLAGHAPSTYRSQERRRGRQMVGTRHTGFGATSVRFSLVAILAVALFGEGGVAHATCTDCTYFGTGALDNGAASGTDESAFGVDALLSDNGVKTTRPPE